MKMQPSPLRFVAVDWSGAKSAAEQGRRIVVADWQSGCVTLSAGRTREATTAWLIEQSLLTPAIFVGLDFSFSLPAWFVKQSGANTIEAFWQFAADRAENWLESCNDPFWGRPSKRCPPNHREPGWRGYRLCEQPSVIGWHPKSTFQIGGAGAVGTGSLRGFATLLELRRAGFSVWPFHEPGTPCVLEIYPRSFTGAVRKSSAAARSTYMRTHLPTGLSLAAGKIAAESEDAFDALCSVIGMARQWKQLLDLNRASDPAHLLEGDIFPGRPLAAC